MRHGSSKTVLSNFKEVLAAMAGQSEHECDETCHCVPRREHLRLFFSVELSAVCYLTPASASGQKLIMRGKYWPRDIENLLRRYVKQFVESPCIANSFDTRLER